MGGIMSVRVRWYNVEQTIIYYQFTGIWTWEEFAAAFKEVAVMMQPLDYKVDFIIDMRHCNFLPAGTLGKMRSLAQVPSEQRGITVLVGLKPFMVAVVRTFLHIYWMLVDNFPFEFASSVAEAYQNLMRYREEQH
jgi:hypothetical protein